MEVWMNLFKNKDGSMETSILYSSRRAALIARERQSDKKDFINGPIKLFFDLSDGVPVLRRCEDCTQLETNCSFCYFIKNDEEEK